MSREQGLSGIVAILDHRDVRQDAQGPRALALLAQRAIVGQRPLRVLPGVGIVAATPIHHRRAKERVRLERQRYRAATFVCTDAGQ